MDWDPETINYHFPTDCISLSLSNKLDLENIAQLVEKNKTLRNDNYHLLGRRNQQDISCAAQFSESFGWLGRYKVLPPLG